MNDNVLPARDEIPTGYILARTTPVFNQDSVPAGLLAAHKVAKAVWGLAVVETGTLGFSFEDEDSSVELGPGDCQVIPPERLHHVTPIGAVTFRVEFYKAPD